MFLNKNIFKIGASLKLGLICEANGIQGKERHSLQEANNRFV